MELPSAIAESAHSGVSADGPAHKNDAGRKEQPATSAPPDSSQGQMLHGDMTVQESFSDIIRSPHRERGRRGDTRRGSRGRGWRGGGGYPKRGGRYPRGDREGERSEGERERQDVTIERPEGMADDADASESREREPRSLASVAINEVIGGDRRRNVSSKNRAAYLEEQLAVKETEARAAELKLRGLQREMEDMKQLMETRGLELQAAQAFLSAADQSSTGDIVNMMQKLNDEIFQTASFLADGVQTTASKSSNGGTKSNPVSTDIQEKRDRVKTYVGDVLVEHLSRSQNPTIGMFAFQAILATMCKNYICAWSFDEEENKALEGIYNAMKEKETQPIFGKWRALARTHERFSIERDPDFFGTLRQYLSKHIMDVYAVMGCRSNPMAQHDMKVQGAYWDRMAVLAKQAIRARNAITREVTTSDIFASVVTPGAVFDAESMTDAYPEQDSATGQVLCTVGLGLKVVKKVLWDRNDQSGGIEWQESWLLKPKIVLESLLLSL